MTRPDVSPRRAYRLGSLTRNQFIEAQMRIVEIQKRFEEKIRLQREASNTDLVQTDAVITQRSSEN